MSITWLKRLGLPSIVGILVITGTWPFFACQQEAFEKHIVAKVNGELILVGSFLRELRIQGLLTPRDSATEQRAAVVMPIEFKRKVLNQMVRNRLVLQHAQRDKIVVPPKLLELHLQDIRHDFSHSEFQKILHDQELTEKEWSELERERLMIEICYKKEVSDKVVITPKEIAVYYVEHQKEFNRPEQIRVEQIVMATEAEAHNILADIRANPNVPFEKIAKRYSLSPEAQKGGDVGFYSRGELPEVFDKAFDLPIGKVSDVIESPYGFHIFKPIELRPAHEETLEQATETITGKIRQLREAQLYDLWIAKMVKESHIVRNDELLKRLP